MYNSGDRCKLAERICLARSIHLFIGLLGGPEGPQAEPALGSSLDQSTLCQERRRHRRAPLPAYIARWLRSTMV